MAAAAWRCRQRGCVGSACRVAAVAVSPAVAAALQRNLGSGGSAPARRRRNHGGGTAAAAARPGRERSIRATRRGVGRRWCGTRRRGRRRPRRTSPTSSTRCSRTSIPCSSVPACTQCISANITDCFQSDFRSPSTTGWKSKQRSCMPSSIAEGTRHGSGKN